MKETKKNLKYLYKNAAKPLVPFRGKASYRGWKLLSTLGLAMFVQASIEANYFHDLFFGVVLIGFGSGIMLNPLIMTAMGEASSEDSGLASGIINSSMTIGGAIGLAIAASIAASCTAKLINLGSVLPSAINKGYHAAFMFSAILSFSAVLFAIFHLHYKQ